MLGMLCLLLIMNIQEKFKSRFGTDPIYYTSSPGRLEILGNHTDYNLGLTLACTVDFSMSLAIGLSSDELCKVCDLKNDLSEKFSLDKELELKTGSWIDYYKGMCLEFKKNGLDIPPFKATLYSNIPQGGGMSSSAAMLISAAKCLSEFQNSQQLSNEQIMLMAQRVEHNFIGVKTGLLDYLTILFGKKNKILLCDFKENIVSDYIDFNPEFTFLVADSGVKHSLVDSEYNTRRFLCEQALGCLTSIYPNVNSLRDVSIDMLNESKEQLNIEAYKKALHVVEEIERVKQAEKYLKANDYESFGQLLYESHKSSIENFNNSCVELDCLIELSKSIPNCLGARLSGGGFGGVSIHLVKKEDVEEYNERLKIAFKHQTGKTLKTFVSL